MSGSLYTRGVTPLALVFLSCGLALAQGVPDGTPVTITGVLQVLQGEDFAGGKSDVIYRVEELQSGKLPSVARRAFQLEFDPSHAPGQMDSGATVEVHGHMKSDGQLSVLAANGDSMTVLSAGDVAAAGDQPTIVFLINFQDKALSSSATPSAVSGIMFSNSDSMDAVYKKMSEGTVGFAGKVVGPYTVPFDSTSSDYYGWAQSAESQYTGGDLSSYTRRVFVSPTNGTGYAGVGNLGGSTTRAWIFYWNYRIVYAHELGHNLGMHHSSTPSSEYGDSSCIMGIGNTGLYELNAPHKAGMGWIPASRVIDVKGSGDYTLTAAAEMTTSPQVLHIPVDNADDVWVSYRNKAGYDAGLSSSYAFHTSVHTWSGVSSAKTYLQGVLADNATWTDSTHGITVTQIANDGITATVRVSVQAAPGVPTLAISPSASAGMAGTTTTYTVSLTNTDSGASGSSTFLLSADPITNWTIAVSPASLTLAPGATGTAQLQVTSPVGASDTNVGIRFYVDDQEPLHRVNTSITHYVDGTAPTAPGVLTATAGTNSIALGWQASSDANADLGLSYQVFRDGAPIGQTSQLSFSDSPGSGTFTYTVQASDAAGNVSLASASATATLTVTTKGHKGKGGGGGGGGNGGTHGKKK